MKMETLAHYEQSSKYFEFSLGRNINLTIGLSKGEKIILICKFRYGQFRGFCSGFGLQLTGGSL